MAGEILNTARILPSFNKWVKFLSEHDPKMQTLFGAPVGSDLAYKTSKGVVNRLTFVHSITLPVPAHLMQLYESKIGEYPDVTIEAHIGTEYFHSKLQLDYREKGIVKAATIQSANLLGSTRSPDNEVFLALNKDYVSGLISDQVVQKEAGTKVWVRQQVGKIAATIEDSKPKDAHHAELPLSDEALKVICRDTGLDFNFNPQTVSTSGRIGSVSFNVQHVGMNYLNEKRIWDVMTGATPEDPFVFPVNFTH